MTRPAHRLAATHRVSRRWLVLAVVCSAAFTINLATTAVNVALPTLVHELSATTQQLQWIVDAYNLVFATFVLAGGSLSDRFGRKGALLAGLGVFAGAAALASQASTAGQLIAGQAVMGLGAAVIYPTTLSILCNIYTGRAERATAIGVWGATTGIGVACGPIMAGALIEHGGWGHIYWAMAGLAVLVAVAVAAAVRTSRDPAAPRLDFGGLALSVAAMGLLVYTIIEAPTRGWGDPVTLGGFTAAGLLMASFVGWERRQTQPMMDVRLFTNPRFSAASASVTFAFFALFGFVFLITQYFQFVHGYGPLSTGLRILPVATSLAVGSVVGVALAVRIGNKIVVAAGLALLGGAFGWIALVVTADTPYPVIVAQMIPMGLGLGLAAAPATEAIMGVVPTDKAGIGSAMNDATRETGGTLGVAVIGSVYASVYAGSLHAAPIAAQLPPAALHTATESIGAAQAVADQVGTIAGPAAATQLRAAATTAFLHGLSAGCLVAAGVAVGGALIAAWLLPAKPVSLTITDTRAAAPTP